jgi:hypothetical protein
MVARFSAGVSPLAPRKPVSVNMQKAAQAMANDRVIVASCAIRLF